MNAAIRWRIVSLQAILVVVLAAAGGFALYEGNFVTGMIHDELVSQQIFFPNTAAYNADASKAEYGAEFKNYVADTAVQIDNGDKARVYANDYIAIHMQGIAGGKTYSQMSGVARGDAAKLAAMSKTDPGYADLQTQVAKEQGQVTTLFQGDTLRSSLLNAYGWYTFGTYTIWAGIGLMLAALVVLGALVFELFVAGRKPETIKIAQKIAA